MNRNTNDTSRWDTMIVCGLLNNTFPPPTVMSFTTAMSTNAPRKSRVAATMKSGLVAW